jgi:hypothetical protein
MPSSRSRPDLGVRKLKGWQNQATERPPSVLVLVWAASLKTATDLGPEGCFLLFVNPVAHISINILLLLQVSVICFSRNGNGDSPRNVCCQGVLVHYRIETPRRSAIAIV